MGRRILPPTYGALTASLPLQIWDDAMYINHLRMPRVDFEALLSEIEPHFPDDPRVKMPVSIRLALTLSKLAHSEADRKVGTLFGVPEGSVNLAFHQTIDVLFNIVRPRCLPELTGNGIRTAMHMWEAAGAPPGCFGAIDGIQIKFLRHGGNLRDYWNYKHRTYCLGSLGVALPDLRFLYFYSGCPGCINDHAMFNECGLGKAFREQTGPFVQAFEEAGIHEIFPDVGTPPWMFGDGGFALRPWLVNPFPGEQVGEKRRFNYWLSSHRQTVERAFGVLLGRWGILHKGGLAYDHFMAMKIIQTCVALHNFCMERRQTDYWAHQWALAYNPDWDAGEEPPPNAPPPMPLEALDGADNVAGQGQRHGILVWWRRNVAR